MTGNAIFVCARWLRGNMTERIAVSMHWPVGVPVKSPDCWNRSTVPSDAIVMSREALPSMP